MGTTGDPATPLEGTRKMAEALEEGRLVVVAGNQHTGYGVNECSTSAVENYLVDPVGHLPPEASSASSECYLTMRAVTMPNMPVGPRRG